MTLTWPWALLALALVPTLLAVRWWTNRRRRRGAVVVSSVALVRAALPARSRWRRVVPPALLLAGLAALGLAAARQQVDRACVRGSRPVRRYACSASHRWCSSVK